MTRQLVQLQSSSLRSASYDPETKELDIGFQNGRTYTFQDVPPDVFQGLQDDPSPGSYFNQKIKGKYS